MLKATVLLLRFPAAAQHSFPATQTIAGNILQKESFTFKVNLTILCGCAVTKGGVWDTGDFEVKANLKKEGKRIRTLELKKAGTVNIYEGTFSRPEKGNYELIVYAFQKKGTTAVWMWIK